jgi:hypothetical protein
MTRQQKLRFHLEMVIWEDLPEGTALNATQVDALVDDASEDQHRRAYERALDRSPRLLPEEMVVTC